MQKDETLLLKEMLLECWLDGANNRELDGTAQRIIAHVENLLAQERQEFINTLEGLKFTIPVHEGAIYTNAKIDAMIKDLQ